MLEHAGHGPLGRQVAGSGAGHLDRDHVLGPLVQGAGDLEGVGEEVALGVAQVGAVHPDVGLVEDALQGEPGPPAGGGTGRLEAAPVEHGFVVPGELG